MKRPAFPFLLLPAAVVLALAFVMIGCQEMTATGVSATSLSATTTSGSSTTLASSEVAGSTTTLAGSPGATVPSGGSPTRRTTTTTAPRVELGEPPLELTPMRYEESDPRLAWSGTWSVTGSPDDSGGSCRFAEYAGSSMKVYFSGVSISLLTRIGPAVGIATITLDGNAVTVDLYRSTWGYQKEVWSSGAIAPGSHTLKIEMPGDSNPASESKGIYVDAFVVTGTLE
jgi:hypothetical protein